jgi:hypothetical protein
MADFFREFSLNKSGEVYLIIVCTYIASLWRHIRSCLAELVRDARAEAGLLFPVLLPHLNNNNNFS